ncbi:50S ribosomal protein L10, partial [Bacillus subtilis]|uniref:50S ribosomal protein L10 n=1 Tax=Bacillus subtilis TaxID=1423 RepID=UPI0011A3C23F
KQTKSTIILHYPRLNVSQLTQLPKHLPQPNVEFKLYKNTITPPPLQQPHLNPFNHFLTPPNPIPFTTEHVVPPPKLLNHFPKNHEPLQIKAG